MLEIGRDSSTRGENHGFGDCGGGQAETREGTVDNGELHSVAAELGDLLTEDTRGGSPGKEYTAWTEHLGRDQLAKSGTPLVDGKDARDKPPLEVVFVGGDELHALVEGDFRFGGGIDRVDLLAVDTDGGDGSGDAQLVQTTQKIVKANGLSSVFFKAYDGQAPIVA